MTWILGYLLIGFVLHFLGAAFWKFPANNSFGWEVAATILWPVTIVVAVYNAIAARS